MKRTALGIAALLILALLPRGATAADSASWQAKLDPQQAARQMFPGADRIQHLAGPPPYFVLHNNDLLVGYALLSDELSPIPGYSGHPIRALIGVEPNGRIRAVRILAHQEPILLVGLSHADLQRFTSQYRGLSTDKQLRIGGSATPDKVVLDGLSGASMTAMVINASIAQSVRRFRAVHGPGHHLAAGVTPHPQPLWLQRWEERQLTVALLAVWLAVLFAILLFQDWLARHPTLLGRIRSGYLWFTLVFVGIYAGGQLSVVNVLTFLDALRNGFRWDSFLLDPVLFLLWSFVAVTVLLWGRSVYCGWLCPFGALQELLYRSARYLRLPSWEPPEALHERLWALKYLLLLSLVAVSLQSLPDAVHYGEVEPFKSVFTLHLQRPWPYVCYALLLLGAGLLVRKAYCRYLCPLGAALTFPSRFRIFDWLKRRRECGRPCHSCGNDCEVRAIRPTGAIVANECHYCLDCQVTYWNHHKCPPLVEQVRRQRLRTRIHDGNNPDPRL